MGVGTGELKVLEEIQVTRFANTRKITNHSEQNHYYPFGLEHGNYNQSLFDITYKAEIDDREILARNQVDYKYKYQGQERQDELNLNWESFKWRNYDYAIGRFMSVNPLAEKYVYNGVYNFSENRVVDARELEGLEAELINKRDANGLETWKVPVYNYQVTYNIKTGNYESKQVSTSYEYRINSETKANTWNGQSELSYTIIDKDNSIKQLTTKKMVTK